MTDSEKLMQKSETMRMLKIGNPKRSKDFGLPELQTGLFELERQTRENLENLIYTSPDPNGSIIKHDTALMLNNLGLDMETARKLAEGGFASVATGIDTRSKSYTDALITKAQHAYWNDMRGVNTSLYRIFGNPEHLQNAQEYDKKVFQNPVFESYGGFGDLVLDSVQPAMSSAKFLLTSAILSWIPGGVANKIWGPAIAKLVAKGGGIAATGVNFLSTGYSQAGNVLYDVMQMTDAEGNTLPWDSPIGGILFHSLAGLMGLVELGSMEMFPWYKQLKSQFTNREVADYLKKGIAKSLLDVTFKGVVGTASEASEEGFQSGLEDGFTNALKALANKDGADFDLISLGDSVKKGTTAFWEAGRSMFLTSFLSAGAGQGVYASKVRIEAAKNFKKSENSQSVDASFLGVPRSAVVAAKAEEAKKGEQAKDAPADTEETKLDPIKVVNVGPRLSPVNDEELRKAAKAVNLGANAVEVEVVEMPEIQAEDQFSLINRAALASGAKIIDGEELGFEDEQSMLKGMYLIAPSVEAVDEGDAVKSVTIRNEDGELTKINMRVIPEDMGEEHISDPDITFSEDPEAPYALSTMSEERALEWEERRLIRDALGDVTTHTKGRFSSADIEASIDAVKTVAETLNMPTDKLLSEGLVFHLTDKVQDEWGNEALGSITSNITVDGKKQYTINLSKKANVSTVLHELGHLLRGLATKEQLVEFRKYYGGGEEAAFLEDINFTNGKYHVGNQIFDAIEDARDYVIGNEERFADDFIAYMMTGEAPTAGLKNIFRRMKAVLHRFIAQYGNRLTPEVKEAFDNLIAGKQLVTQEANNNQMKSATGNVGTFDGSNPNILFQPAPPTDSEAFKAWFGDSKVVDENGNPLVVYHGTIYSFNDFRMGDIGFHFGDIEQAEARVEGETNPNIMAVYLSIENPYISSYDYGSWDGDYVARGFIERGEFTDDADVAILKNIAKLPAPRSSAKLRKFLRDKGYDGVVYPNAFEGEGDSYIAFSPTQVKSATDNIGTFDGENPNILFQKDLSRAEYAEVHDRYYNTDQWMKAPNGEWSNLNEQQWVTVRTPEFLDWFGNWIEDPKSVELALDENGEPEVFYHGSYTDDIEIFKIQPRLGYYNSDRNRGGFSFTNNKEKAEAYAVPRQKRVNAISNYLRELESALEDEGIVDLESLEDPDDASPRLKRFYELLEEDEDTTGYTFEGRLPTFEYVYWDGDDFPFREGRELWSKHVPRVIEKEFPELAKRLRKAGRDLRVGRGMTTPKVYEVFLRIPEGTNTKSLTPKTLYAIGDFFDVSKEKTGAFVVLMPEGEKVAYIADSKMIKSATDNVGTFDGENPNILYQKTMDDRYFDALDRGDEETARKIVDDMARKRGYLSGNDFRMNHKAPNGRNDYDVNLPNLDGSELLPKDFWDHPRWYADDRELYSFWKVKEAIDRYRRNGKANLRLYRAVPKDVREDWFRNGDWVTPDRTYAQDEGALIPGGYRIIFHSVPIEHVWWDVNSIAELGYDDGGEYVYRNTKNNRKLFDTVVRDADGKIVPPSKRFNFRSDTLYQKAPKEGTKEFEQTFASTKIVDENGNPRMVYHGSMREWQGADTEFDPHEIGSQSDPGDAGEGFYFATTPLGAYAYTNGKQDNVHGYYLDIRNPFVIGEQYDRESRQAWEAVKQDKDPGVLPTVQMIADMVRGAGYDPGELTKFRGYTSVYDVVRRVGSGNFSNLLKANGYDGVVYGDEIVAFDPDQIYYASKPATLYQIEAYHGTSKNFDKFSTDFIGSGFSGGAYGWGLYFTTDEDTARNYAEIIGNRNLEKRALYRVNLGRVGKHTLLPWSEPINERVRSMLREPMLKLEYPRSLHLQYGTSTTEELVSVALGEKTRGVSLYFILEKAFDDWSGKKASLFLREHGITGTVKSDLMGNYTYAIFDENAVEIVGKTLYKMAPPLETEDFKEWYGSSVLVDGKGNPIELLHGSPSMFNDFARTQENDNGYLGAGHYFTGIRGVALTYATKNNDGYIYHAYLKMENPLRYDQEWDKKWTEIRNEVVAENPEVPENSNLFGKLLAEKVQDNGYDGVLDMRNGTVAEAVVFSNDQVGIVAVESYNLGEAGSEYNRRKIGEMGQRQIAKNAVQQAIPDLALAQGNLVPPTLYQVQNLPKWKEDTRAWMKANGYTGAQIDRHIAGIEGQLKIFDFVGPYEIDLLPHGAGLNPWKRVSQKGDPTYQGGPIRTNDDPIYRISFDLSAMCPKRLSAAATANYVQKKIGRPLSDSERMALTALYRAHGKEAPCIYCYVESPRSKASSFVLKALEVVLGGDAPKTWSSETLSLAEEARAEAVAKNVQRGDLNAHMLMDPELASSDEFKAEVDKYPAIYKFLKKQMLNAKANLPKLYEEYEGQILNLPDDFIDMLNGYAGIRFFSSSDFQAQHVVDLIQAVYDMNVRGAKAHAYTKVPKFVEVFGGTGIKINTSIFAKEENGQIVEDNWQGMGWEDAKRFRQQYPDVGTILVASSDNIVKWALEQDWIDYIIPFHYSSLEKKYYSTMKWEDFTSTQVEKSIDGDKDVQKIRQYETGSVDGVSVEQGTKNYLELAMKRRIIPVFPTFLFKDGMDEVLGKNGKPYKNQRKAKTDRAVARWREMVESGEIDWSQINPNYYKLRKDYARTDTPFGVVQPNFDLSQASEVLKEYLSGAAEGVQGERAIGDELVRMIIDSEGTDIDLGVEVLKGVQEGRMSGKETLFQRMSPPGSQEFMSWYKGSMLVDGDGAPLKLYHGTASIFTEYNSEYGTLNMGDSEGSEGFFFTTDKDEAISYAEFSVSPEVMAYKDEHRAVLREMKELGVRRDSDHALADKLFELEQKITEAEDLIDRGAQAWDPVVSGVYVRITNPVIIDLSDPDTAGGIDFQQLIQEAKANGHDGFIYKNVDESDVMHVVAFTDSQVGAVEYSLSSEGFETEHEFPAARDSILESAIEYKGHKIIPHDLGMDYSEKNLDGIIEKVDQELKQITLYQSKLEWEPYPLEISTGKRLTQKEKGFKDRAYTNMWGWDGSEDHPTIDEDWTKFRKLDLEGAIVRDVSDIAKLFSIYRNPYIEFFHIIYTREMADGTIKIKGHHAMTSGAPAFTMATSRRFPDDIAEGMKKYRATGYYLMHNHPSGDVYPSWQDRDVTVRYIRSAPGFKGHIILDHNEFYLYDISYKELREWTVEVPGGGFHGIPRRSPLNENGFSTSEEIGEYGIKVMGSREMLVIYLDNKHRAVHVQPVETLNIDEIYENVEKYLYSKVVLVTSSKKRYQEALDADRYARVYKGEAFLDIVLHHTLKKDGSVTITSARAAGQLGQSGHDFWHTKYLKHLAEKGTLLEADYYAFEKGETLYQLSDEARKRVVESRKQDVKAAIEQYYWIPDDVLQEYVGEDWADREIRFRTRLKENPWVLGEARGYTDPDEYLEFVTSRDRQDGKEPSAEARKWWRRAYEYARVESAAERNLRFVREHASTDKDLIALGKRLRGYITTDQKTGKRGYRLGAFKGVSPLVKTLSPNSSSEDIQKARTLVTENPEPYRKALQKIVQAERVVDNDGKFDLPSKEDREAYYDSLGEEMSDALKEPLLINQLGGEDAEFHRESYTEREKMATLNGVLEIENQADKELTALRSEYDRKSNSLTELQKRFDIVTKEVNKLGDELREVRKDRNNLKRTLKGTQKTAVNLREALAEKREAYRKLERERKALERKLHAVRTRRDLEKYHKAILASAKFNPDSVDASYEEALNTIHDLFRQDYKEGGYEILPEMLTRYLDDEGLHAIKANKRIGDWSLQDLGTLYYAIRAMKADARVMLEQKKVARSGKLQNLAIKYYSQLYGELPEIDPLEGRVMGSIMEELSIKQKKYQEGMFGAIWNTVAGAMIHSQRLARIIDGNREGVMYDLLVRRAYENSSKELSHSFERLEAAEAKMRELGVTDKSLRQDLYTYTTVAGDKITLNRGEVIGLYVYSQNELSMEKLIMPWGNGIQPLQLAEAVGKLTDAEKAWGDYMIDNLGGDDPWERMRDVYYNVYNQNLGRRKRYFTFVADGNLNEGNTDILNGPKGRPIRYTDKGMTKKVVPHARYALKLDVTSTFTQQVKRQEHFIAWAEWVRDMNYLLSSRGSIGAMIEANHGSKILTQVQDFVNDIGSPQVILDDIERLGNKILSNAVVGALSFNALTPLKQLASLSAVVRGDIDISSLFHAARRLGNPAIQKKVVEMIHEKSPKMKNRTFDVEVAKYKATEFDTEIGMIIKSINENVGLKAIGWMDQFVANLVWLSAYDTAIKRGATDAEAAFRATEVVGETQSSTNISDLSSLQRKKSPWVRSMLMFTNDIVQHVNQIWFDMPYYVRSKQYRKAFGTMASIAMAGAITMLVSGQLFRGDDDDEEYLKKIAKAILGIIVSDTIPIVGNAVESGVSGWGGGDMVDLPSAFGRFLGAAADLEGEKLLNAFLNLIEAGLKFGALPVTAGNRVVRAVREQNPLHLLNYDYAELWEEWL